MPCIRSDTAKMKAGAVSGASVPSADRSYAQIQARYVPSAVFTRWEESVW